MSQWGVESVVNVNTCLALKCRGTYATMHLNMYTIMLFYYSPTR